MRRTHQIWAVLVVIAARAGEDAGYDEITHINWVMMQAMPDSVIPVSNGIMRFEGPGRYAKDVNLEGPAIKAIIGAVDSDIPVQLGGGIRDLDTIERYLDDGVSFIVIGTAAVKNPGFLHEACDAFPGHIIVGLDAKDAERSRALRQALILGGVDFNGARALVSTCHTDAVIDETVAAFETAIRTMREEGLA